jgi:hypothetical protein
MLGKDSVQPSLVQSVAATTATAHTPRCRRHGLGLHVEKPNLVTGKVTEGWIIDRRIRKRWKPASNA